MQPFTPALADACYNALVQTIRATDDDIRRWAFVQAIAQVHFREYRLDSMLGITGRFCVPEKGKPRVTCTEITTERQTMLANANKAIQEILQIKPAKKIRKVPIKSIQIVHKINVHHQPVASNER